MTWLAILRLLLSLASTIASVVRDKQLMDAGEAKQIVKNLEASRAALDKADRARTDALKRFDDAGGVPDEHDPNLRD